MERKNFLERLQSADDDAKQRWLVAASVLCMVIVVFVWLKYFNTLVEPVTAPPSPEGESQGFSFWQSAKNGTALLYEAFLGKIQSLGEILSAPRSYIIKPPK